MDVNSPDKWDANYEQGTDGWDLGGPTPVFRRLLRSQRLLPGRMIVLGAGRGHDAREFARQGYVLEYTCMCAIDPARRAEYADLVRRLLKPEGMYVDLAFPLDGRKGGPPFAVSTAEILDLFQARGFRLLWREKPVDSIPRRRNAEELLVFQKKPDV